MTKIDIYSGFLGAGKTTLIKKMLKEVYAGQKIVLIENEFGEIGIDGGFLQDAGVEITEMNSGCICCTLVGDFSKALQEVLTKFAPDRVVIEPSGVGKLSDVIAAVEKVDGVEVAYKVAVADAGKVKSYMRNFGEFYNNQIEAASAVILSRTQNMTEEKLHNAVELIREHNPRCVLITTPWDELSGDRLKEALEGTDTLANTLKELEEEHHCCGQHHHEHHHDEHCGCEHHHEHHHDEHCSCGHDHHHHHADEAFTAWGAETAKKFTREEIEKALHMLDEGVCGTILRAKGIVPCTDGGWLHFDYVPQEHNLRFGAAGVIGKLCVIGAKIDEAKIAEVFGV